jgi:polygalacturonase
MPRLQVKHALAIALFVLVFAVSPVTAGTVAIFNVKDYGATGVKSDDARAAIQKTIEECAKAGGGMVYLPPGQYTSGTIHLRSHVRFYIEAGATLYASTQDKDYEKIQGQSGALIAGEDLEQISIEGRGTVDGEIEFDHRPDDIMDYYIKDNKDLMLSMGKSVMRAFPKSYPDRKIFPHLLLLVRCKDVRVAGLTFQRSPSWTFRPFQCERLVVDGVHIYSSLEDGVWEDGIDPDGCKDVLITNSIIETGDDALVFYSTDGYGPARACENITVTNSRFSSASSAIKFCDGNSVAVRNVLISNSIINNSNRGLAFMTFDGGYVRDVLVSNVKIDTRRFDWFWWGDGDPFHFRSLQRREINREKPLPTDPPAGVIRDVKLQNIIARGKGTSNIEGHPNTWLDGIEMENVKLYLSSDPKADYNKGNGAMKIRWARNFKMRNVEVHWEDPIPQNWQNAIAFQDVSGVELDNVSARQSRTGEAAPAITFDQASDVVVRNSRPQEGTGTFLDFKGEKTGRVVLRDNDFRRAQVPYRAEKSVKAGEVKTLNNILNVTKVKPQ